MAVSQCPYEPESNSSSNKEPAALQHLSLLRRFLLFAWRLADEQSGRRLTLRQLRIWEPGMTGALAAAAGRLMLSVQGTTHERDTHTASVSDQVVDGSERANAQKFEEESSSSDEGSSSSSSQNRGTSSDGGSSSSSQNRGSSSSNA